MITLTESAIQKVKELNSVSNQYLKIGVKSGGCSGFTYYYELTENPEKFDFVIRNNGIKLIIDNLSLPFLAGMELNWISDLFESKFVFNNSNEKSRCGCGKSASF